MNKSDNGHAVTENAEMSKRWAALLSQLLDSRLMLYRFYHVSVLGNEHSDSHLGNVFLGIVQIQIEIPCTGT